MALNLPNTLSNLIFDSSPSASLVQQSLTTAVQPILNFINQNFASKGSGNNQTLTFQNVVAMARQLLVSSGSLQNPGVAFKDANGVGFFYDGGNKRVGVTFNGVLVGYFDATGCTVPTTLTVGGNANIAGSANVTGTATANSMVSAQGFKAVIPAGCYYLNNTAMTTAWTTLSVAVTPNAQNTATSLMPSVWIPCHSGSITGMSAYLPTARATGVIIYFRTVVDNGAGTITYGATFAVGNVTLGKFSQPYAKGLAALSFTAGCYVYIQVSSNSTATASFPLQANLEVELGA